MTNSTIKPKPCKTCGSPWHSAMFHKPRHPIVTGAAPKRTAIKKQKTKLAFAWEATRQKWFSLNTSPYTCHYCGTTLYKKTVTLDHKIPRSRAPELRNDLNNLVPACGSCNYLKGSVDHDSYEHTCH